MEVVVQEGEAAGRANRGWVSSSCTLLRDSKKQNKLRTITHLLSTQRETTGSGLDDFSRFQSERAAADQSVNTGDDALRDLSKHCIAAATCTCLSSTSDP